MQQNGNLSPLLQSIYKLSRACENDVVGGGGILEEEEQQQVHSLIESAKKIMEQVSSKRAQTARAPPRTPASNHPDPDNSRFHDHTNLYPERFRLYITPRSSPAAPQILPSASIFPASAAPAVASVLAGVMEWAPPRMQHGIEGTVEEAVSKSPDRDSTLAKSAIGAEDVVSPARSQTLRSGEVPTTSATGDIRQSGKGESARDCPAAVGSGA